MHKLAKKIGGTKANRASENSKLLSLPKDVLELILGYLGVNDLATLYQTCKWFNSLLSARLWESRCRSTATESLIQLVQSELKSTDWKLIFKALSNSSLRRLEKDEVKALRRDTKLINIAVMGSGAVGTTALIFRFVYNLFPDFYDPVIDEIHRTGVFIGGHTFALHVLETPGQEEFYVMRDEWIKDQDGIMVVYCVTHKTTLDDAADLINQIKSVKGRDDFPIVLVGNKKDVESQRVVSSSEGEALAKTHKVPFIETSALTSENVVKAFELLILHFIHSELQINYQTSKKCSIM